MNGLNEAATASFEDSYQLDRGTPSTTAITFPWPGMVEQSRGQEPQKESVTAREI